MAWEERITTKRIDELLEPEQKKSLEEVGLGLLTARMTQPGAITVQHISTGVDGPAGRSFKLHPTSFAEEHTGDPQVQLCVCEAYLESKRAYITQATLSFRDHELQISGNFYRKKK